MSKEIEPVILEEMRKFISQITPLTDRAMGVSAAVYLDLTLAGILRKFFVKNTSVADNLLEKGALQSFSARIEAAYALGLISKQERENLNLIREIRNKFSHWPQVSFRTNKIRNSCMKLKPRRSNDPRTQFHSTCQFLLEVLVVRLREVGRRETPQSLSEEYVRERWKEIRAKKTLFVRMPRN